MHCKYEAKFHEYLINLNNMILRKWLNVFVSNVPFHGVFFFFFKLLTGISQRKSIQTAGKKRPKISEVAKFESDLLKTNENIAPQSREITDVWWGGGRGGT